MLQPINGLPAGIAGFEAKGPVTAADYRDVFAPAIEAASKAGRKLGLLYVAGPDFETYETGAAWEEAGPRGRHLLEFEKIAFVSDRHLYGDALRAFGWTVPADAMVFPLAGRERALAWLSEADGG